MESIVNACKYLLNNYHGAEQVKNYLNSRLSQNIQDQFDFGYFPFESELNILTSIVPESVLIKNKLIYEGSYVDYYESDDSLDEKDYENSGAIQELDKKQDNIQQNIIKTKFVVLKDHNLIMPYRDVYGETVSIVGRTILENYSELNISKYKNTSFDKTNHLFGLNEAKKSIIENNCVYVVEGQFDCISAIADGMTNTVAVGSSNITLNQLALLLRYTNQIYLLFDNDDAGQSGRDLAKKKFEQYNINLINIYVPEYYKDQDEFLKNNPGCREFVYKF